MKRSILYGLMLCFIGFAGCKSDSPTPQTPQITNSVTSPEFDNELLFVNKNNFRIQTNNPAKFSSTSSMIKISEDGTIERLTSSEVVSIEVSWTGQPGVKTTIYALGATDDNHDEPYARYHGELATDAYSAYRKGWQTLRALPVANQTHALIVRHGDADDGRDYTAANPGSNGPPNWWKSCDRALARQLNAQGKARSTELGKIFKDLNYPIRRVISSEFCRSVTTAELINAGPAIQQDGRINHPEHNTTGKGLFNGMLELMKEQPVDNNMTLMVLHHPVNETSRQGYPSFPLVSPFPWTGAYIVAVSSDKTITYQGAVSYGMFNYWRNLKLKKV